MTTTERIFHLLEQKGIEQQQFAQDIGVRKQAISEWKTGKTQSYKKYIDKIASYFNVSTDYLLGNTDNPQLLPRNAIAVEFSDFVRIPIVGRVAAGLHCLAEENIEGHEIAMRQDIIHGQDYIYLRVQGDSMEPLISEDDLVLVRLQPSVDNGDYAVVMVDEEELILLFFREQLEIIINRQTALQSHL